MMSSAAVEWTAHGLAFDGLTAALAVSGLVFLLVIGGLYAARAMSFSRPFKQE